MSFSVGTIEKLLIGKGLLQLSADLVAKFGGCTRAHQIQIE